MKNCLMYLSAFIPMFWIILIKDYSTILVNVIRDRAECKDFLNIALLFMLIMTVVLTIIFGVMIKNNKILDYDTVIVNKIKNRSAEYYLGYFSLFILALISFSFTNLVDIIVMILILIILGVVYIKNGLFFINPTINLFKGHIYEVEYYNDNIIQTKILFCNTAINVNDIILIDVSEYDFSFAKIKGES